MGSPLFLVNTKLGQQFLASWPWGGAHWVSGGLQGCRDIDVH